jgi:hypothetical protein
MPHLCNKDIGLPSCELTILQRIRHDRILIIVFLTAEQILKNDGRKHSPGHETKDYDREGALCEQPQSQCCQNSPQAANHVCHCIVVL